jgi:ATP-dependent DNA ligase
VYAGGRGLLRSRRGTDMTASFPEIRAAALAQLPADTGIDGELVVWERDRLAFERCSSGSPSAGQLPLRRYGSGRRTSWPST